MNAARSGGGIRPLSAAVLRRLLVILLPVSLFLAAVLAVLYYQKLQADVALYRQIGLSTVDLQREIVSRQFKEIASDLFYLSEQGVFEQFLREGETARSALEAEHLSFCRNKGLYDQIRFLDLAGKERVRINYRWSSPVAVPLGELQPKGTRYYFREAMALKRGDVFISPFDLNVEHGTIESPPKPVIRFATPIFNAGVRRGLLALNFLGDKLLTKLDEAARNAPGTFLLLNREGYYLRGPQGIKPWGFMFGRDETFARDYPDAWRAIAESERDQFETSVGLFSYHRIDGLGRPSAADETGQGHGFVSPGGLVVVSFIPSAVLGSGAWQLLRVLAVVFLVAFVLVFGLAWYLAYVSLLRRQHEEQVADSEGRLRVLSTKLLGAQEEERRRIARDLHDEFGQLLTAISLDLQRAEQRESDEKTASLLRRALEATESLLEQTHTIATRIRPSVLDDLGLKDAIEEYLSDYQEWFDIALNTELQFDRDTLPGDTSENVFRILQEALTNVAQHAHVGEAWVRIHVATDHVALSVWDEGSGFDPAGLDNHRLGILGMRERAELLGGWFRVESAPGKGTRVETSIPIDVGPAGRPSPHEDAGIRT